jgi:hypothetical protein
LNWNNAVDKVPTLLLYPAYERSESILFEENFNPVYTNIELIKQEAVIEFILINSNNENTIKEFLINNCLLDSKLCFNKLNINELVNKKILRLKNSLMEIKTKTDNFILNKNSVMNNNRTYYDEYLNLLNRKYIDILNQINLFQNFMF